jgi:gliding motility-associated protein GldM
MAIKKRPVSPRQKMINLMYVVLMAMLALNVSTEVLNGFSIVEESLNRTTANASKEIQVIYENFEEQLKANPAKVKAWFDKAMAVKGISDSIYNFAEELKLAIVVEADGSDADVKNILNKEDLEAANQIMLAPERGKGQELFNAINSYRKQILSMVESIMDKIKLQYPCNIQFKCKDGVMYLLEINTRMSGGLQMTCEAAKINIPGIALNKILGRDTQWTMDRKDGIVSYIELPRIIK